MGRGVCMIYELTSCCVDDKPDLSTLRAFVASTAQGISYNAGIWREFFIG